MKKLQLLPIINYFRCLKACRTNTKLWYQKFLSNDLQRESEELRGNNKKKIVKGIMYTVKNKGGTYIWGRKIFWKENELKESFIFSKLNIIFFS